MIRQRGLELFGSEVYGPQGDFEARPWQVESLDAYRELSAAHENRAREMRPSHPPKDSQHRFCLYAGTGAGKTCALGLMASYALNTKKVDQIIYVCPNRRIQGQVKKSLRKNFNIDLMLVGQKEDGERQHTMFHIKEGIPPKYNGIIITYQFMASDPDAIKLIASYRNTLVVFDEVHHLSRHPARQWGSKAVQAFENVPFVISMTGTPYSSIDARIEFISYVPSGDDKTLLFQADVESGTGFTYSLGRAIAEGVCRKPHFMFHRGIVKIRPTANGPEITTSFDDKVSDAISSARLRGAVEYPSKTRKQMLRESLTIIKQENRRAVIFVGGDSLADTSATKDAHECLPPEIVSLDLGYTGDDIAVFTYREPNVQTKMNEFERSAKTIAISSNMMSEGSDHPSISAVILLTTVTSWQTTVQRIGRALRMRGEPGTDKVKNALVFLFADPSLLKLSADLEKTFAFEEKAHKERTEKNKTPEHGYKMEAFGIGGGEIIMMKVGDGAWPIEEVEQEQSFLKRNGMPSTLLETALSLFRRKEARNANGKP